MDVIIIFICLILSAFFSGVEIAYISANKIDLEIEKNRNTLFSKALKILTKNPSKFIASTLVGNSISLVIYGLYFGNFVIKVLFPNANTENLSGSIILVQTALSTIIILLTAEFLPKIFFRIYSNVLLKVCLMPSYIFYILFYPVTSFIIMLSDIIMKYFLKTSENSQQLVFTKSELGYYISEQIETVKEDEEIDSEIEIFRNALNFAEVKARDAMVQRTEISAIDISETPKKLTSLFIETGHSKILVYKESIDNIVGYVYAFELFKKPKTIKSMLLPIDFIPETMLIKNVLSSLTKRRKSIAVILDEFGGTAGIITVEDMIEKLFGNIEDEYDIDEFVKEKINDYEYKFSARLDVEYINKTLKIGLPESEDYETLGGLIIFKNSNNIPQIDDIIQIDEFEFKILESAENKLDTVHLKILKDNTKSTSSF